MVYSFVNFSFNLSCHVLTKARHPLPWFIFFLARHEQKTPRPFFWSHSNCYKRYIVDTFVLFSSNWHCPRTYTFFTSLKQMLFRRKAYTQLYLYILRYQTDERMMYESSKKLNGSTKWEVYQRKIFDKAVINETFPWKLISQIILNI